jgi:hypothetical protein
MSSPNTILYSSNTNKISFVSLKKLFNDLIKTSDFINYIKSITKVKNTSNEGEPLLRDDGRIKKLKVSGDLTIKSCYDDICISYVDKNKYIPKPFVSEVDTELMNKNIVYIRGVNFTENTKLDINFLFISYEILSPTTIKLEIKENIKKGKYRIKLHNFGVYNDFEDDMGYMIIEDKFTPLDIKNMECWYNENSIKSNPVETLYDLSGNKNNAFQKKRKLQPIYNQNKKCLELRGTANKKTEGQYFRLSDFTIQTIVIVLSNMNSNGIHGILGKKFFIPHTYLHINQNEEFISFDGMSNSKGNVFINGKSKGDGKDVDTERFGSDKYIVIMEYKKIENNWKQLFTFTNENRHKCYRANCDIHEIICYKKKLDKEERKKLENHLSDKWNIELK